MIKIYCGATTFVAANHSMYFIKLPHIFGVVNFLLKPNRDLLEQITVQARETQLDAGSERSISLFT